MVRWFWLRVLGCELVLIKGVVMKITNRLFINVLFSLLGYLVAVFLIKMFISAQSNAAILGIIIFGLSPIVQYKFKNINPIILFLINFCATFILGLIL